MKNNLRNINILKAHWIVFLSLSITVPSCFKDADFSGLVRSSAPVEERFSQSMEWNAHHPFTNIIVTSEDYNLLVTADVHVGNAGTIHNYLKFIERGIKSDITAMVFAGDISTGKEEDQITFKNQLPDQYVKPSFVIMGNHELYYDGWEYFYRLFGSSTYYFTIQTPSKQDLYICLDTGSGTLGKSQFGWLKNILDTRRKDFDKCVIVTHQNFFRDHHTGSTNPLTEELISLMDLFEKYQVNMVITGHDHRRALDELGNVTYVTMDALKDDAKNATYLLFKKQAGGFDYDFVKPGD